MPWLHTSRQHGYWDTSRSASRVTTFRSADDERGRGLSQWPEQPFWDVPPVIAAVPWLTAEVSVRNAMTWVVMVSRKHLKQRPSVYVKLDENLLAAKLSYSIEYGYIFRDFAFNVPAGLAFLRMATE